MNPSAHSQLSVLGDLSGPFRIRLRAMPQIRPRTANRELRTDAPLRSSRPLCEKKLLQPFPLDLALDRSPYGNVRKGTEGYGRVRKATEAHGNPDGAAGTPRPTLGRRSPSERARAGYHIL